MFKTKRCAGNNWTTLEWTVNQPVAAVFRGPAGAEIEVGKLFFGADHQILDGVNNKVLRTSLGKIQIKPKQDADVTYAWYADGKPGDIVTIHFP
jgi:hypothetical protein